MYEFMSKQNDKVVENQIERERQAIVEFDEKIPKLVMRV
jgi:hypothetical protein